MKWLFTFIFLVILNSISFAAPPSFVTIISPQDGSHVNKTVAIEAELTQVPQVRSVKFYIDDQLVGEDITSPYQYYWDTTTYSDGQHTIYASALQAPERPDLPEQQPGLLLDSPKIIVTVDNTPPNISITSPQDNSFATGTITTEANVTDNFGISKVEFKIDDALLKEFTSSPYTYQFDTAQTQDGAHTFTVIAYDLALNKTTSSVTFTIDNSPPLIPVVTDDGAYTTSLNFLYATWSSEDPQSGIIEYLYSVGTTKGATDIKDWTSSGTASEIIVNDLILTQGETYYFNVRAKNGVGLWSQTGTSDGIIANDGTTLLLDIISPLDKSVINTSSITVTGIVSRNDAQVKVNGKPAQIANNTFSSQLNLIEGTHTIVARAEVLSQVKLKTIQVSVDTTAPRINILIPDKDATTKSNIIYGRVSEDTIEVTVNDIFANLLENSYFIIRLSLTEGLNILTIKAKDKAGNTTQIQHALTYDTQTPKVTITSPQDNSTINISPIKVEGTNSQDIKYIIINYISALIDNTNFIAEGLTLASPYTVITASGYDANNNKFSDSILINTPELVNYELTKVLGDMTEDDPNRPVAGSNHTLKVRLSKNNQPAPNEQLQFKVTQGNGALSSTSSLTDINGEATVILTTDTNSDITNQVECSYITNSQVKTIFSIDTRPGLPSILTKITDDSITPVPGATLPLIVTLTDQYNNPIQDEQINFLVTQGTGALSSNFAITNYYGEAKVNLTLTNTPLTLIQITASSNTNSSITTTFNITTSQPLTITIDDIINKVNQNDSKIQDIKADITVTSNAPFLPQQMQLKIWQKGEKQKVQEILPEPKITIRPPLETTETIPMDRQIISYDPSTNIYIIKSKVAAQSEEKPYELWYVDYERGIILKEEAYYNEGFIEMIFVTEYSEFVQLSEADNAWVYNKKVEKTYEGLNNLTSTTTISITNRQVNTGIPDGEFQ